MKYIQAKFILCAMLAVSPMFVSAQATDWNETDSLANEKDPMVQVAFRKVAQKDLLGGVSVVNVEELTKKNYNIGFGGGLADHLGQRLVVAAGGEPFAVPLPHIGVCIKTAGLS